MLESVTRWIGRLAAVVPVLLALAMTAAAQPSVSAVRLGQHPDKTRFVMEIDEAPAYRIFTLPDPYRVVIDLPQVDWQVPEETLGKTNTGVVEALRFGLFAPGTSRVVLDAKSPVKVANAFVLPPRGDYPHRLVIDLTRVSQSAFQKTSSRTVTSEKELPMPGPRRRDAAPGGDERPTVMIDAGHGGVDPGAIGVSGTREKDIVIDYARHLKKVLESSGRYRVVMTRDKDIFLRLRHRVELAQEAEADLFISLHANTHNSGRIRGASVYTLSENSSDSEAAALAAKENKADIIAGVDLNGQTAVVSQILIDLAQRETMNASKSFANMLVQELDGRVKLLNNTHRYAGFAVLKSPNVPSILFEIGYMSNPTEERQLRSKAHKQRVSAAIHDAVDRFFEWQEARNRN
jgi:N-acetylmuramoyl-L-alanine amidase